MFVGKDFTPAQIEEVSIDSPAHIAGLKKNDIIKSINGKKVQSITEVSMLINTSSSEKINIKVSKLAQGFPVGGEIESLDDGTLISAFKNRKNLSET